MLEAETEEVATRLTPVADTPASAEALRGRDLQSIEDREAELAIRRRGGYRARPPTLTERVEEIRGAKRWDPVPLWYDLASPERKSRLSPLRKLETDVAPRVWQAPVSAPASAWTLHTSQVEPPTWAPAPTFAESASPATARPKTEHTVPVSSSALFHSRPMTAQTALPLAAAPLAAAPLAAAPLAASPLAASPLAPLAAAVTAGDSCYTTSHRMLLGKTASISYTSCSTADLLRGSQPRSALRRHTPLTERRAPWTPVGFRTTPKNLPRSPSGASAVLAKLDSVSDPRDPWAKARPMSAPLATMLLLAKAR